MVVQVVNSWKSSTCRHADINNIERFMVQLLACSVLFMEYLIIMINSRMWFTTLWTNSIDSVVISVLYVSITASNIVARLSGKYMFSLLHCIGLNVQHGMSVILVLVLHESIYLSQRCAICSDHDLWPFYLKLSALCLNTVWFSIVKLTVGTRQMKRWTGLMQPHRFPDISRYFYVFLILYLFTTVVFLKKR